MEVFFMSFYSPYKSLLGYSRGEGNRDSYDVDHSGFTTRDEVAYQIARQKRENQAIQNFNNHGITKNYPPQGANFWGKPDNNYGFGVSDISQNIENVLNQPFNLMEQNQNINSIFNPQRIGNDARAYPMAQNQPSYRADDADNSLLNHFSEDELLERMMPVIRRMEKPLDYIYIDTTWNKTTGAGANVDDWNIFNRINWEIDGRLATEEEKRAVFDIFQNEINQGLKNKDAKGNVIKNNKKASSYLDYSQFRLATGEIDRLLRNHITEDIKYLKKEFPDFASYPPELQNVLLDIKFNTGNVSQENWPKLRKAIAEKNLFGDEGILQNVHRKDVGEDRNSWAEQQIRNIKSW